MSSPTRRDRATERGVTWPSKTLIIIPADAIVANVLDSESIYCHPFKNRLHQV